MDRIEAAAITVDDLPARSRSLRVAVVTETYPPEINGVSLTVARMIEGLHRRDHAIQLIRPRQKPLAGDAPGPLPFDEVLVPGLPIPLYPNLRMGLPAKQSLQRLWSMRRPDVVHIATEGPLGYSALKAADRLKLPVTSDFRTNFHAYSAHYGAAWMQKPIVAYLRRFHNATRTTMVPTEALRRELVEIGFRRLAVVARGVDTVSFSPERRDAALRRSWGADDDTLVVTCVGRLAPEKNLTVVIAAFAAIRERWPHARLLFVGEGPLKAELAHRCPAAQFAGERRGSDLAAHYASADLFLFPSLTETFGNVTLEAMASGLPVVAFDYAAAAQLIVDGETGALVAPGDDARFIAVASSVAGDPAVRRRMGQGARARAASQSWDDVVGHFEAILVRSATPSAGRPIFAVPSPATA